MRLEKRLPVFVFSLGALLLGACATAPKSSAPAPVAAPAPIKAATATPLIHEGPNYRYVERSIVGNAAELQAPYWLSDFEAGIRVRVLPPDNQGVALALQAAVAVPKLLVQDQGNNSDRIHVRLVNRGDHPLQLAITCRTRTEPVKQHANVKLSIGANKMIDLAVDTPSADRSNLLLRVR